MSAKPSKFPLKWLVFALIIGVLALLAYWFLKPKQTPPTYLTAEAVIGDIQSTVLASGKVKPIKSVDVGAEVSGRIVKLYVDVGDEVKRAMSLPKLAKLSKKIAF